MHSHVASNQKTSQILQVSLFATAAYIILLVVAGIRSHS